MFCPHFEAGRCRSCSALPVPHAEQLEGKQARCRELLSAWPGMVWETPWSGAVAGFRNKAKMAVSGSVEAPVLGILDGDGHGVDLADCLLYPAQMQAAFEPLREFITRALLPPYDIRARRGELKYLLLTLSPSGQLMLRFVLRSSEGIERIRKHLPWLLEALPMLQVVSVNLQPLPAAVLEGEQEIVLGEHEWLPMPVNGVPLRLGPQSFFQTRTDAAAALYAQAAEWASATEPRVVWDLFCGVGGFALHLVAPGRLVIGIERSEAAIGYARGAAREMGSGADEAQQGEERPMGSGHGVLERSEAHFVAGDATPQALAELAAPDLVVVNPPRRGIGEALARSVDASGARTVIYSSCNPESLAKDLAAMPGFQPVRGRIFDMFPHTAHLEVLVELKRLR